LVVACSTALSAQAERPNVLIILADDLGRGDYSAFGTSDIRTPAIDRLFREGMDLTNFRANCPVCSPTRAALLTGMYPDRAGVPGVIRTHPDNSWGYLRTDVPLLPQRLKGAGYHTALVGKWHLGLESPNTPTERGFDFFHGFLGDMMDDYWTHLRHGQNYMRRNREVIEPRGHATDLFSQWACAYLEERATTGQPFFLYLAFNAQHDPIQPPVDWIAKVQKREAGISLKRAKLVALIEHMDAGIGRVLDTLDRHQLAENTIVIFSSDNGGVLNNEAKNGPWRGEKQQVYEGGLRVPCGVRWPGKITAGSQSDRQALTMDLMATCCEAAGVQPTDDLDAISFLPTLLGRTQPTTMRDLYFVRREGGRAYGGKTIEAIIRGDWKLLQNSPFAELELYNLRNDPNERMNLVEKEPRAFADLSAALRRQIQQGGAVPWQAPKP
jgi:arylsulfatase A-like enzyme